MARHFGMQALSALLSMSVMLSACASSSTTTRGRSQPAPESASPGTTAAAPTGGPARRQQLAEMFARGYFPGRSGQIFLVPREGDIITSRDPLYRFMHGSPWDYDVRIPFLLYGAPYIQRGRWPGAVSQQDMAPTLAAVLGTAPAATMTGRVLTKAIAQTASRPRVVVLLVFDGMRADYFDRYADAMPTLSRMRGEGAWFPDARVTALPSVTSVGHANIGTGTEPRIHGQSSNTVFNYVANRAQPAYWELDPSELSALAIGDLWNIATDGKAVIVGQGGAIRATAGLVGHGSCLVNGRTVLAASYDANPKGSGKWETNPKCYRLSKALDSIAAKPYWERAGGTWMGHDIASPTSFRASSLFQRFEGDALVAILEREAIGTDDVTDLVLVNMKGPDYTGHAYGPDSPEIRETLAELDRQTARLLETLDTKAGPGQSVIAITADHGMPSEPAAGRRHYGDDVVKLVHDRFDKEGRLIRLYANDTANSQFYLDRNRLRALGVSLKDIAAFLETQEFIAAAFTEDEVVAAMPKGIQ
jgi:hypothetical protein